MVEKQMAVGNWRMLNRQWFIWLEYIACAQLKDLLGNMDFKGEGKTLEEDVWKDTEVDEEDDTEKRRIRGIRMSRT